MLSPSEGISSEEAPGKPKKYKRLVLLNMRYPLDSLLEKAAFFKESILVKTSSLQKEKLNSCLSVLFQTVMVDTNE